ncbi:MAG: Lrp/AsnC family transcriptional regulator [Anaerolineae bacterium]|nr:Lrp/AsnC family transcriptional regulator [Anaerolineae bacterium]
MKEYSQNSVLDELDRAILLELQKNGRISHVELSRIVNLSPPAIHTRIKRLEQQGYIDCYAALVNRELVGYEMLCFISVSLQVHQLDQVENFRRRVTEMPEVLECYHLTGEYDYLLKVAVYNQKSLQQFLMDKLTPIPGIGRIHTSLVLTEIKHSTVLSL